MAILSPLIDFFHGIKMSLLPVRGIILASLGWSCLRWALQKCQELFILLQQVLVGCAKGLQFVICGVSRHRRITLSSREEILRFFTLPATGSLLLVLHPWGIHLASTHIASRDHQLLKDQCNCHRNSYSHRRCQTDGVILYRRAEDVNYIACEVNNKYNWGIEGICTVKI